MGEEFAQKGMSTRRSHQGEIAWRNGAEFPGSPPVDRRDGHENGRSATLAEAVLACLTPSAIGRTDFQRRGIVAQW